jgi:hydrogenase nickel incorporation protein HypA/HybF
MHELALANSICELIAENITNGQKVVSVTVEWGPVCGVELESLAYCFSIVASHHGFQEARLEIRTVNTSAHCPRCEHTFSIKTMWDACPTCNHSPVTIQGGRDFSVKHIEVEEVSHV